ncbi:trehalase-like isoform X1 [Styela clava]
MSGGTKITLLIDPAVNSMMSEVTVDCEQSDNLIIGDSESDKYFAKSLQLKETDMNFLLSETEEIYSESKDAGRRKKLFCRLQCLVEDFANNNVPSSKSKRVECYTPIDEKERYGEIYCYGPLLSSAQFAHIEKDSKTFVDMKMKNTSDIILQEFDDLQNRTGGNPTDAEMTSFVNANFEPVGKLEDDTSLELEKWTPQDWTETPVFLESIADDRLKSWASHLNKLWKELGCRIKDDVKNNNHLYSMIYSSHPIIVPGGRFREFYYWDNYWIIRGLLLSEMFDTVKGSIHNFLDLVNKYGFVPNGGRIYYTRRSQPPFLTLMVREYFNKTGDTDFLVEALPTLKREYDFWMTQRNVIVEDNAGNSHVLNRYASDVNQPRPESYREDYNLTLGLDEAAGAELMSHMTSACESGWDFSSRWTGSCYGNDTELLRNLRTRDIVPVDLNSILAAVEKALADFNSILGNNTESEKYMTAYDVRREAIEKILWNEEDGVYYDYLISQKAHNRQYFASNVNPLWTKCYPDSISVQTREQRLHQYLKSTLHKDGTSVLDFPGGIPTSLNESGEQWDFPNAWPPLVHMIIEGMANSDVTELQTEAFDQAQKWITTNWRGYNISEEQWMFEKYIVTRDDGVPGAGGEYDVQAGFGWTNGVDMVLLDRYGEKLTAEPKTDITSTVPNEQMTTTSSATNTLSTIATAAPLAIAAAIIGSV